MEAAYPITQLRSEAFPPLLQEINDPPEKLYLRGTLPDQHLSHLCVVGSRKYTQYGKEVCERIIAGLASYPLVIVSGLALGTDALAHKAALKAGLPTIAIPGSGLNFDALHPRTNIHLAREILEAGGALLSEFEPDFRATPWSFPKRNRIMAGITHATLVIEAEQKSGTLITSRLATEYNRDVLTVPGSIFSPTSKGPHMLLRLGATPITKPEDILEALDIDRQQTTNNKQQNLSKNEQKIIDLLREPLSRDELIRQLALPIHEANILISAMELKGLIAEQLGTFRAV